MGDFFDENFTPFYRTSQVIITSSVERPVDVYKIYPGLHSQNFSGIMYKDILDEVGIIRSFIIYCLSDSLTATLKEFIFAGINCLRVSRILPFLLKLVQKLD